MERRSTRQLHANTTEAVNGVKVIELLQTLKELYMTMYNVEHNRRPQGVRVDGLGRATHSGGLNMRKKLKKKTIYLYQYNGYNGGFAQRRILLWRCTLVGANGEKEFGGSWMSEGTGNVNKEYAERDAARWAEFLGWPVVDLGRSEDFDDSPRG